MPQQHILSKHATTIHRTSTKTSIQYHNTIIVEIHLNGNITLRTNGWFTPTTKTRMNQTASMFNLPYYVYQKNFNWYIHINQDTLHEKTIPFTENEITFNRKGEIQ